MNEKDIEILHFYRLYSIDFDTARHTLKILNRYRRNDVRFILLQDIVVSYARPFSVNKGKLNPKHKLSQKVIPKDMLALHQELLKSRNKLFAHTDLEFRNPKIGQTPLRKGYLPPMSFKFYDYSKLDRKRVEITKLIDAADSGLSSLISQLTTEYIQHRVSTSRK